MTDTELVKSEIQRFLSTKEPEVLCISGKWGVGKTFTWQQLLDEAVRSSSVRLERYAYVSLFGINSLEGLKLSIFENTEFLVDPSGKAAATLSLSNKLFSFAKQHRGGNRRTSRVGQDNQECWSAILFNRPLSTDLYR